MTTEAGKSDIKQLVQKFIPNALGQEIERVCNNIYPLENVYIRKVKVLKTPKFDGAPPPPPAPSAPGPASPRAPRSQSPSSWRCTPPPRATRAPRWSARRRSRPRSRSPPLPRVAAWRKLGLLSRTSVAVLRMLGGFPLFGLQCW